MRQPLGRSSWATLPVVMLLTAAANAAPGDAADPCSGFTWNVARELALFAGIPQAGTAGAAQDSAPALANGRLYELALAPQEQVHFAVPPTKKPRPGNTPGNTPGSTYGGLAKFRVTADGLYRISLDQPYWVDVIADGKAVPSKDFQGRPGCTAPHKVVEFELSASQALLVQFSNAVSPRVRVTITPAIPSKS
jgi:hypothetical protein